MSKTPQGTAVGTFKVTFGQMKGADAVEHGSHDAHRTGKQKTERDHATSDVIKRRTASATDKQFTGKASNLNDVFAYANDFIGTAYLHPSLVIKYGHDKAVDMSNAAHSNSTYDPIDCSGFISELMRFAGFPGGHRDAEGLFNLYSKGGMGSVISEPRRGALIFFAPKQVTSDKSRWDYAKKITHVALSDGGDSYIDSNGSSGVSGHHKLKQNSSKFDYIYVMPNYSFNKTLASK